MVVDKEPVADIGAAAVDGDRLAGEALEDGERDQLLDELVRARNCSSS